MKKTFTLLAVVTLISAAALAQNNNNGDSDNNYANNNYGNNQQVEVTNGRDQNNDHHHYFGEREKNIEIDKIKYHYDVKIDHVANSFFMSRHKKEYRIADLQTQRDYEISCVVAKFNERKNQYDQHNNHFNDHDRRNW